MERCSKTVLHHSPEHLKQLIVKLKWLHTARPADFKSPEAPKNQNLFIKKPSLLFLFGWNVPLTICPAGWVQQWILPRWIIISWHKKTCVHVSVSDEMKTNMSGLNCLLMTEEWPHCFHQAFDWLYRNPSSPRVVKAETRGGAIKPKYLKF